MLLHPEFKGFSLTSNRRGGRNGEHWQESLVDSSHLVLNHIMLPSLKPREPSRDPQDPFAFP